MVLDKFRKEIELKNRQKQINKKYEKEGATDEVMRLQVQLNTEKHRADISDPTKRVHKNYVQ